jgi:hypothetical protein
MNIGRPATENNMNAGKFSNGKIIHILGIVSDRRLLTIAKKWYATRYKKLYEK